MPPFQLATPAHRIISLVPSQTELLAYLGLEQETIGITKFCVHPTEWFRNKTRIGGTKNANIEKIISLHPDLILCIKEENVKEQVEMLAEKFPLYMSDVRSFEDALEMIKDIGKLTGKNTGAAALVSAITKRFSDHAFTGEKIRAAYLIWQEPYMTIGGDSFISAMMEKAGFENIYRHSERYPVITVADIKALKPQVVLLSSEPFPFKEKHIGELQAHLPETKIVLVDGEMFSWYGSRMLEAPGYFQSLRENILSL